MKRLIVAGLLAATALSGTGCSQMANTTTTAACMEDVYQGRNLAAVVGMAKHYGEGSLARYYDGLERVQELALHSDALGAELVTEISAIERPLGLEQGFGDITVIRAVTADAEKLVGAVEAMMDAGLTPEMRTMLGDAYEDLYVGNVLMIRSAQGLYWVYQYASKVDNNRDAVRMLEREGAGSLADSAAQQPGTIRNTVVSLIQAGKLAYAVDDAIDFSEDEETLRELGIEAQLDAFAAAAERQAAEVEAKHPEQAGVTIDGANFQQAVTRGALSSDVAARLGPYSGYLSGLFGGVMASLVCGTNTGYASGDTPVSTPAAVEPAAAPPAERRGVGDRAKEAAGEAGEALREAWGGIFGE